MTALVALAAAVSVVGAALAWHRLRALARLAGQPAPAARAIPPVSIVVPARDEAHNLPALLASLARLDPAPAEIIVVDDHSRDGTGAVARAAGVTVIEPPPLPPGWLGKSWACHAGAAVARGELLLFTDADTVHPPASLGQAVARLERERADLLSAVPRHRAVAGWERCQGPFQLLLLIACRAGAARGRRRFSIGQYLLWSRAAYRRVGGHRAVRAEIAEDLALAERVVASGGRFTLVAGSDTVAVRMYPEGLAGFARGWRRSIRAGLPAAGWSAAAELSAVIGWLVGVPAALGAALVTGTWAWAPPLAAAHLLTVAALARAQRLVGRLPWWGALAYPLAAVTFVAVSAAAAVDHVRAAPVRWRGRTIDRRAVP